MQRQLLEEVAAGLAHYLEQGRREAGWLGPQDSRPAVRFSRKDRVQSLFGAAAAASGALSAAGAGPAGTRAPWADRDAEGQTRCESLQQDLLAAAWKQWAEQEQKVRVGSILRKKRNEDQRGERERRAPCHALPSS